MNREHEITRREVLRRGTALAAGLMVVPLLEACGQAAAPASTVTAAPTPTPLPAPETTTFRIQCASCDAPIMAAERYLRDEGFTDVQITDTGGAAALASGKLDMTIFFPPSIANAVQSGTKLVALGGIHPGCVEIWAPQSVPALTDLRGKTVVVRSKALSELGYSYLALVLKQAGVDPTAVNFVVQADADPVKLYLEGKNDAVRRLLSEVDGLIINDSEARLLAGELNTVVAARRLLSLGLRFLVIKRGEYGAALFAGGHYFAVPAYPVERPVDPTGAGDSFAGGFMGHLARSGDASDRRLREAMIYGSVLASYCVEDFSLRRLGSLSRDDIEVRAGELRNFLSLDGPPAGG